MKKKKTIKEKLKIIEKSIFILSLTILIYGLNIFWIGFHNIDLCHNEMNIQNMVNKKFNELGVSDFIIKETKVYDGEIWSLGDCYIIGLKGIIRGLYISIAGAFALGYTIWR